MAPATAQCVLIRFYSRLIRVPKKQTARNYSSRAVEDTGLRQLFYSFSFSNKQWRELIYKIFLFVFVRVLRNDRERIRFFKPDIRSYRCSRRLLAICYQQKKEL